MAYPSGPVTRGPAPAGVPAAAASNPLLKSPEMTNTFTGEIMIEAGLLTAHQVDAVLHHQRKHPKARQSFGHVAAKLFQVSELAVLEALAEQARRHGTYARLHEQEIDRNCLYLLSPREAWDQLILPLHFDHDRELICATTVETLPTAIAFLQRRVSVPFRFVLADLRLLEQYIAEQYDYEGVDVVEEAA